MRQHQPHQNFKSLRTGGSGLAADHIPKNRTEAIEYVAWANEHLEPDDRPTGKQLKFLTPRRQGSDGLLLRHEAADYLNITDEQLKAFIDDGTLRYINVGRGRKRPRYRFSKPDLEQFIASRTQEQQPCPSTGKRNTSISTSPSVVIGFTARRAALLAAKPKGLKR